MSGVAGYVIRIILLNTKIDKISRIVTVIITTYFNKEKLYCRMHQSMNIFEFVEERDPRSSCIDFYHPTLRPNDFEYSKGTFILR